MTALSNERDTARVGTDSKPGRGSFPVGAGVKIYKGALVLLALGYAIPGVAGVGNLAIGRAMETVDNTLGTNGLDANGAAINVQVDYGVMTYANSANADALTAAHYGRPCYVVDDQTIALTDGGGLRSPAGICFGLSSRSGQALVLMGMDVSAGLAASGAVAPSAPYKARFVEDANVADLTAYTVAGSNGTCVAGDVVLLVKQTTAAENGPYVVGTVATGTAPLTRPPWWLTGNEVPIGAVIDVGPEGTAYKGSSWKTFCAKGVVIGTGSPLFWPKSIRIVAVALAAGTKALGSTEKLWLRSVTDSVVNVSRNTQGGTSTAVADYDAPAASRTAGIIGTGAITINANTVAGALVNTDTSTLDVHVSNW